MADEFVFSQVGGGFVVVGARFGRDLSPEEQEKAAAEMLAAAERNPQPVVIVDLSEVEAANSAFLQVLLTLRRRQHDRGGRVVLAAMRPLVAQTLNRCALDLLFECFPTVQAAVSAVGEGRG